MFIRNINCDFSFYVLPTPLLIRYHSSSYLIYFLILSMCKNNIYFLFFFLVWHSILFCLFDFFPLILPSYLTKTTRRECFLAPKTGITTVERWIMGIYDTLPDMICMLTFCVRVITIITGFVHVKYSMGFLIFAGLLCNWGGAIGLVLVIDQKHDTLLLSRGCYKPAWCLIFHLLCLSNLEGHMLR